MPNSIELFANNLASYQYEKYRTFTTKLRDGWSWSFLWPSFYDIYFLVQTTHLYLMHFWINMRRISLEMRFHYQNSTLALILNIQCVAKLRTDYLSVLGIRCHVGLAHVWGVYVFCISVIDFSAATTMKVPGKTPVRRYLASPAWDMGRYHILIHLACICHWWISPGHTSVGMRKIERGRERRRERERERKNKKEREIENNREIKRKKKERTREEERESSGNPLQFHYQDPTYLYKSKFVFTLPMTLKSVDRDRNKPETAAWL